MLKVKIGKGRVEISNGGGLNFTAQDESITVEFEESLPAFSLQIGKVTESSAESRQSSKPKSSTNVNRRKGNQKSIPDYIEQLMEEYDRPMLMVDIVEKMPEVGYAPKSKHWKNTVRSIAYRYKPNRFIQYDESTWGLTRLNDKWRSEGKLEGLEDSDNAQSDNADTEPVGEAVNTP